MLLLTCVSLQAQERLQNTLLFGQSDANKILRAYAEPGFKALGRALAEGWHASARPLHTGRLNFQVSLLAGTSNNTSTDLRSLNLQVGQVKSDKPTTASLMGNSGGVLLLPDNRGGSRELNLLNGSSLPVLPIVTTQLNIGLFRNTEANLRLGGLFFEQNTVFIGGWGFKHELKQWFPAIALANFDWAIFGNYTIASLDYKLSIDNLTNNPDDQFWKAKINTLALGSLVSKRFALLTLAAGLQYQQSTGDMSLTGTYLVGNFPNEPMPMQNPVSSNFRSNGMSFIAASRISLGWLSFQMSANISQNSSVGASIIFGRVQRR